MAEFEAVIRGRGEPGAVRDALRSYLRDLNSGAEIEVVDASLLHGGAFNRQAEDIWPLREEAARPVHATAPKKAAKGKKKPK